MPKIEKDYQPGDTLSIHVNQGIRPATVLARIEDIVEGKGVRVRWLCEYEMPRGTTALQERTYFPEHTHPKLTGDRAKWGGRRNMAYANLPKYWLEAIINAGMEWIGNPQGYRGRYSKRLREINPVRDEYMQRFGG